MSSKSNRKDKKEREAESLVKEVQQDIRPDTWVFIPATRRGHKAARQKVLHRLASNRGKMVRTTTGDVWLVREVNRGGCRYEAQV